ncbi:hypothetical protein F5Y17DRAFT_458417 [Xylariaceae sp. FL0594]|nr:hypothetical protein F5Y17DRAFT_458417 [Xylariaceae sp. FL0594]
MRLPHLLLAFLGITSASPVTVDADKGTGKVSYDGYRVYRVPLPATHLHTDEYPFSFPGIELQRRRRFGQWTVDIAIAPSDVSAFFYEASSSYGSIDILELLSDDLGKDLSVELTPSSSSSFFSSDTETQKKKEEKDRKEGALPSLSWFDAYHPYAEHLTYLSDLRSAFPNNSELFAAGKSFEGRPLQGIHLWGKGGKGAKPAILFHGNVHAREWITSKVWGGGKQVVEYILYQLISGYTNNDKLVQKVLDNYDFYVIPVVNPDGFIYTQTTDRLWRKNRQVRSNTTFIGTDINRNWVVGWGGTGGSSSVPSSETFAGFSPHDTPETSSLASFALTLTRSHGIKLYIDWHSYAQVILLSYGYTCTSYPPNIAEQEALAKGIAAAIRKPYNTSFDYGPGCEVLYQSNGNGRDYMTDVARAQFGWGIELRDTKYGFVLPPDQILPSGVEIWEGLKYAWAQF